MIKHLYFLGMTVDSGPELVCMHVTLYHPPLLTMANFITKYFILCKVNTVEIIFSYRRTNCGITIFSAVFRYTSRRCNVVFEVTDFGEMTVRQPMCGWCAMKTLENYTNDVKSNKKTCPVG